MSTSLTTSAPVSTPVRDVIDPRGARFAASLTSVVLAAVLFLAPSPLAWALLAAQTLVFAIGAVAGVAATPYSLLFRRLVRPRLGPPSEWEDAAPPRFAQGVGLAFGIVGLVLFGLGLPTAGSVAVALALAAALLNAVFGFCLGCELYLRWQRLTRR